MRDAQDLPLRGDLPHLFADGIRGFAADVRIHFVEDQHGNFVHRRQHGFQREHHARHFAGDAMARKRLRRVRRDWARIEIRWCREPEGAGLTLMVDSDESRHRRSDRYDA